MWLFGGLSRLTFCKEVFGLIAETQVLGGAMIPDMTVMISFFIFGINI